MSKQVQLRRGSSEEHENFTGAVGEVTVDTTKKVLRVHDGITKGGMVLATESQFNEIVTVELPKKANREQEDWKVLTLKNGWSGELKYYKDTIGDIHIVGSISGGVTTNGTTIVTMPSGYMPSIGVQTYASSSNSSGLNVMFQSVYINSTGDISIAGGDSQFALSIDMHLRGA